LEQFECITLASKPLKVRNPRRPETRTKLAKSVKLTMPKRFLPKPYAPSALITMVQEMLGGTAKPIMVPLDPPSVEQDSPVLSTAIKIRQMHSGIGAVGALAQPLVLWGPSRSRF
jgi:hypothetical protein